MHMHTFSCIRTLHTNKHVHTYIDICIICTHTYFADMQYTFMYIYNTYYYMHTHITLHHIQYIQYIQHIQYIQYIHAYIYTYLCIHTYTHDMDISFMLRSMTPALR